MSADIELKPDTTIARADGWLTAKVGDELIMMSGSTGRYIGLTDTGSRIWELLAETRTFDGLCAALAAEYEVSNEEVTTDVTAFIKDLAGHNAVVLG